jgi:hypothetical protein
MVHPRITISDENSFKTTMDSHINKFLGTINEDRSHGRLSKEYENEQKSSRLKLVTTMGINIGANEKYLIINNTKTRMTSGLVHMMLHIR